MSGDQHTLSRLALPFAHYHTWKSSGVCWEPQQPAAAPLQARSVSGSSASSGAGDQGKVLPKRKPIPERIGIIGAGMVRAGHKPLSPCLYLLMMDLQLRQLAASSTTLPPCSCSVHA